MVLLQNSFLKLHSLIKRHVNPLVEARRYVGTDELSGQLQLELLKREGCAPSSKVLEIGCGCLNAGIPIIKYLEKGNYVGIDPNEWLRKAVMTQRYVSQLIDSKQPRFLNRNDFDASEIDFKFDYVFSHSVLSHCAHWQLNSFLLKTAKVLDQKGRILSSIRLAEGNNYGNTGSKDKKDSGYQEWQYPGVSYFTLSTIVDVAKKQGLVAIYKPEYTAFYTASRPNEFHDWIVFLKE